MAKEKGQKVIASNRKARHDYEILDVYEAGVALVGTEVKSLRLGRASLVDSFATVDDGEVWLHNVHIAQYALGSWTNHAVRRKRKLLLHRAEIRAWDLRVRESGLSMVPLSMYFNDGRVKVELALVKGKKTWDRRQDERTKEARREADQAMYRNRRR